MGHQMTLTKNQVPVYGVVSCGECCELEKE